MEETYLLNLEGVKKKILHGGYEELPEFQEGSKITFHFQALKDNFERTVIDDSREFGIPMEIIVGKMFKIEVWETLLKSMRIGEVAEFWCDRVHTGMYALVSKSIRKIAEGRDPLEGQKHRCGMGNMFDYHSTGYADLDELQRTPQALIFIMELFKVEDPSAYKRDTWAMNKEEKLVAVPKLHTEGNRLVLARKFKEAAEKYQEAVICLREMQAKEKPWEDDWLDLEDLINPLVLNYCQCQLELGEYYEVLEHTSDLLQKNNENVKAYFKRAKAHAAVWNEHEARIDFMRVTELDPSLAAAVKKELKFLGEKMRQKHMEDRKRYYGIFDQPVSKRGTEMGAGEATKELSKGQEEVLDYRLREGSRPENLQPEREVEWAGVGEKHGEIKQGSRGEEEKRGLIRTEEKMDKEDYTSQKEQAELVIKTADEEKENRGKGKDHSSSGEGESSCETSMPNQQLAFGEWKPEEEREKPEETIISGAQEQTGELGFAKGKEEQIEFIPGDSGKQVEGAAEHLLAITEDRLSQECYEAEGGFLGAEREEHEAMYGNGETQDGDYSRPQEEMGSVAENWKEWARAESSEEDFEEDSFQTPQERSERGVRGTTEWSLREEAYPDWWDCVGLREEISTAKKEEYRGEMEWEGKEVETDDNSRPVQEKHEYENGCCPGHWETETDPKGVEMGAEDCREVIQDEIPKTERSHGAEVSKARRDDCKAVATGCEKEKTKGECSCRTQEDRQEDGVGLEGLEAEMSYRIEKFKIEMGEESSDKDQDNEDFRWEWPEDTGEITHLSLKEESLSPWSAGEISEDENGDLHNRRGKDTSQAYSSMQMAEPGVRQVPNVWPTKQPVPVEEEAQGNRE